MICSALPKGVGLFSCVLLSAYAWQCTLPTKEHSFPAVGIWLNHANRITSLPSPGYTKTSCVCNPHLPTKRHVIKLGPGNEEAAKEAVQTWPDGLHVGGGINIDNAATWLEAGAQKVIVTSW